MRRVLGLVLSLGVAAVLGVTLGGPANATPVAHAAAQIPAYYGPYYFVWGSSNGTTDEMGVTTSCGDNNGCSFINADTSNEHIALAIWQNGYTQLVTTGGHCLGWNQTRQIAQDQKCTYDIYGNPNTWQLWAGNGHTLDNIWSDYFEQLEPTACPWPGGYTQAVLTADYANEPMGLACPESLNGYTANQGWVRLSG